MSIINLHQTLKDWGERVSKIEGDRAKAESFVKDLYNVVGDSFDVLFKPTLTDPVFSFNGAVTYFMYFTRVNKIRHVEWNSLKELNSTDFMGTYTFFTEEGFITANYSFVLNPTNSKIILHHSSSLA